MKFKRNQIKYDQFLQSKVITNSASGFDVPVEELNPMLFDWQKVLTKWALYKGRSALFEDCGLGKTPQQLEWGNQIWTKTQGDVLILAPLAVSRQTQLEGEKFGIGVNVCKDQSGMQPGINITNYERLHHFEQVDIAGIVLDECFSPDTPIDTFNIDNSLICKYIKDVSIGDKIYNAEGIDYVHSICKRSIDRAIQVSIEGRRFTCSENHPFFTVHGWRFAKDLQAGDHIMATEQAVRLVRGNLSSQIFSKQDGKILRKILLSEMADEYTGTQSKSTYCRSSCKGRKDKIGMVEKWASKSAKTIRKNSQSKSDVESKDSTKNDRDENKKQNTSSMERQERWQRQRPNTSTTNNDGFSIRKLVNGICNFIRKKATWVSYMLQSRFRKSRSENSNRSRRTWTYNQKETINGQEERRKANVFRVDNVKILEQGHPELEKYRDETGVIYFYDIEAKRHPSFSINGFLVHNSSIVKNFAGKIRNQIIDQFIDIRYKLCCTATPAPNDYMELGNHSEFLGVMTRSEMLAMFFINDAGDTGQWRLKGHVKDNIFWAWLSSWAVMLSMPSDLGYANEGFALPEIEYHEHVIPTSVKPKHGFLSEEATTMDERRKVRRDTVQIRAQKAADIINATRQKFVVWCNLNPESETLTRLIDGAVEVAGRHTNEVKSKRMIGFTQGKIQRIVTKPKIAGLGMNWQVCSNAIFVGLSDSWEQFYQAVRRIWRYGQQKKVDIHIVIESRERAVLKNIKRKDAQAKEMIANMISHTKELTKKELTKTTRDTTEYNPQIEMILPDFLEV